MSGARFDLATLAPHEVAVLGGRIRRCMEDGPAALAETAGCIAATLWRAFEERLMPPLALVRVYRVVGDEPPRLLASRGLHDEWNVVEPDAFELGSVASDVNASRDEVYFVQDAQGSTRLPQRELVLRYGVRSAIGCSGTLADDSRFVLLLFARITCTTEAASAFGLLAMHASVALGEATDLAAGRERQLEERTALLERILHTEEVMFVRRTTLLGREVEELRARAGTLEQSVAAETAASAARQERTQRAMLNVIEDLREARGELERRVIARTQELERANAELVASNAELEQFAYVASHDLQEPLRTISGYLQLLQERYGDRLDVEGHEFISYGVRGAQRMQELIEALLTYSRVARAPIELGKIPLERALDEALAAMQRTIAESQATITRGPLPVIRGDLVLLRQLFQNLLSNAVKFAGAAPPRIEVSAERAGDQIVLTVRDHGLGFDPKYAEQVFKVFRRLQRKLPGTGIGLAICRKIVERHGGTIRAVSSPGGGATFITSLPAVEVAS